MLRAGDTETALGNLEGARAAYGESLALRRLLAERFPDQPQFAKDLAWITARLAEFEAASAPDQGA